MSKYFEVRNEDDVVQISDEFVNIGLDYSESIGKYYAATVEFPSLQAEFQNFNSYYLRMYLYLIPITDDITIFVEAPANKKIALVQNSTPAQVSADGTAFGYSSGNYVVIGIGGNIMYNNNGQNYFAVPYISKSQADSAIIHRYASRCEIGGRSGLQCFNANGEMIFNSNQKQLKIIDVWNEQNKKSDNLYEMAVSYTGDSVFTKQKLVYDKPIIVSPMVGCYCDSTMRDIFNYSWLANLKWPIYILDASSVEIGYVTYCDFYPGTINSGYEESLYPKMNLIQMAFAPRLSNYTHYLIAERQE